MCKQLTQFSIRLLQWNHSHIMSSSDVTAAMRQPSKHMCWEVAIYQGSCDVTWWHCMQVTPMRLDVTKCWNFGILLFHISLHAPTGPAAVDALLRSALLTAQVGGQAASRYASRVLGSSLLRCIPGSCGWSLLPPAGLEGSLDPNTLPLPRRPGCSWSLRFSSLKCQ